MQISRYCIFLSSFIISLGFISAQTADSIKIYLWPEGAPYALGTEEADKPSITIYFPAKERVSGAGVLICPGGGYLTLALNHEGWQAAKWYNSLGITAAILRYRVNTWDHRRYKHPVPFMDATRAMRLFRSQSQKYGLNPEKIGVMGFSAGGHLASMVSTLFDGGDPKAKDPIEKVSSRPNFSILIYPFISLRTKYGYGFSQVVLGDNAGPIQLDSVSTEIKVSPSTPSTFLLSTSDDAVRCENSLLYFSALRENNVSAELHIYEKGGHGYGLFPMERKLNDCPERIADWPERLKNWLHNRINVIKY